MIQNWVIIAMAIVSFIALLAAAYVTSEVFRHIEQIGKDTETKRLVISKALFNFYAIVMVVFVILVRVLGIIDTQLFISLFIVILGGLGFKISYELVKKK
jgi:hypothetical protein